MLEASVSLTPLQRAIYTVVSLDANKRKVRAAMRVAKAATKEERERALTVLVALGFIQERQDQWL